MTVVLNAQDPEQLIMAADWLAQGKAVALPTETVYGLAALALDEKALAKIFTLKDRPTFDPLICHVLDLAQGEALVRKVTPLHRKLCNAFWPGPLTLLFEKSTQVPDLCTAGTPLVALRCPSHPVFRKILELVQMPLAAPSANRFGRVSPTLASDVVEELGPWGLEAVVDGGACQWGIESSIVKILSEHAVEIVRHGSLSQEQLQQVLGEQVQIRRRESGSGNTREAPGQLSSHYAPRTPLYFVMDTQNVPSEWAQRDVKNFALLEVFGPAPAWQALPWKSKRVLSRSASDAEAAAGLYRALRDLDKENCSGIVALAAPDRGLGRAINDRLRRAAGMGQHAKC